MVLVGLIRQREHCAFTWEEPVGGGRRVVRVYRTHCADCIAELEKLGYLLVHEEPRDEGRRRS
jgi:hypothetical protein